MRPGSIDPEAVERLFDQAIELPVAERAAFLEAACRGDSHLRSEVESLLVRASSRLEWERSTERQGRNAPWINASGARVASVLGPCTVIAGRYRLESELGRGAFGVVYLAEDADGGARVAVKLLNIFALVSPVAAKKIRRRFDREVKAGRKLTHPLTIKVLDTGEHASLPFLVMEYVAGESLEAALAKERLPLPLAVAVLADVLEALSHAHSLGVIHRDVKPANVILDASRRARLADFGIAKLAEEVSASLTNQGDILGTPSYMSPEQASGAPADHRSDLFSVGLMGYELLTGTRAFKGQPAAVLAQIRSDPLPARRDLSVPLKQWLDRACEKDAGKRFQNADEMRKALLSIADRDVASPPLRAVEVPTTPTSEPKHLYPPPAELIEVLGPRAAGSPAKRQSRLPLLAATGGVFVVVTLAGVLLAKHIAVGKPPEPIGGSRPRTVSASTTPAMIDPVRPSMPPKTEVPPPMTLPVPEPSDATSRAGGTPIATRAKPPTHNPAGPGVGGRAPDSKAVNPGSGTTPPTKREMVGVQFPDRDVAAAVESVV